MLICSGTELEGAISLAEKLRQSLHSMVFPFEHRQTASFGVAEVQQGEALNHLMKRVDEALYHAKGAGRDLVVSA